MQASRSQIQTTSWQTYMNQAIKHTGFYAKRCGLIGPQLEQQIQNTKEYFKGLEAYLRHIFTDRIFQKFQDNYAKLVYLKKVKEVEVMVDGLPLDRIIPYQYHNQNDSSFLRFTTIESYRKILFQNHRQLIKFLQKLKYNFKNIASHTYIEKGDSEGIFYFDVERGMVVQDEKHDGWNCETNIILFYILIRDLSRAIIEIQRVKIFQDDLNNWNFILLNSPNISILRKPNAYFAKIAKKLIFKMIDFGNAFLMDFNNKNFNTEEIIKIRQQIIQTMQKGEQFYDPFTSFIGDHNDKFNRLGKLLPNETTKSSEEYRLKHAQNFEKIIKQIGRSIHNNLKTQQYQKTIRQILELGKNRLYEQIQIMMSEIVDQWIKSKEDEL